MSKVEVMAEERTAHTAAGLMGHHQGTPGHSHHHCHYHLCQGQVPLHC